ncbi:hypothetical protein [Bradyrhizobium japonicum]|uniref:hypothetical protein n=1 Tax=Bradyrhizobium japonicum TaxID=375 RepID=UPI0004ACFC18|nr:hypothetical protein [Bradyrhizobium japonicum]MCD9819804.1 hypothetical protein [Bradyrhizobium japonicum]MEB2675151.1 hypothetical protein [Bradyrhizobium japonicum]WLB25024.1 hypothetical protein QIH85_24405 [Bradyrhizobium japonicum]WRI85528.1 hypothetical protein R3F75_26470 [Bradyrhizobium japonicum]
MWSIRKCVGDHGFAFLLAATLLIFTAPQAYRSYAASSGLPFFWTTSKVWIESAECAQKTSKILVICRDDKVMPIADGFGGDDLGHALTLELITILTGKVPAPASISALNTAVNYLGLVALAFLLFSAGMPLGSFALLTVGTFIANQFHALSPHPSQFGAACFAAILPIAIVKNQRWIAAGFIGLVAALMLREAIGMMGVVASLCAVVTARDRSKRAVNLAMAVAIFATAATPYALLRARDAAYNLPAPTKLESHGTWANLYMGLGAVENPFAIEWSDFSAIDAVKAVDPSVDYLSPRFYEILKGLYFKTIIAHPLDVVSVYFRKLLVTLHTPILYDLEIWHALILVAIGAFFVGLGQPVLLICFAFIAMFLAQATLFHFHMQYLFPIKLFALIAAASVMEALAKRVPQFQKAAGQWTQ